MGAARYGERCLESLASITAHEARWSGAATTREGLPALDIVTTTDTGQTSACPDDVRDDQVVPYHLGTEDDSGLVASATPSPRLSWRLLSQREAVEQVAYQLQVADDPAFEAAVLLAPAVECRSTVFAAWPAAPLRSRERRWWRVRVRTDVGWTKWSDPSAIEGSLYDRADWSARPVSPASNVGRVERSPVCLLRREFDAGSVVVARLYISALGVYEASINGIPVSTDLLEPGWTDYRHRTLFSSYDVLPMLRNGRNCLAARVADGWWRGELGWMKERGHYGDTTALLAQLELITEDGRRVVVETDPTWRSSYGSAELAELYDGADIDLSREPAGWRLVDFDDRGWEAVVELGLPVGLQQRSMPAVRTLEVREPAKAEWSGGVLRVDAGQNLAGFLRVHATGPRGASVSVRHAEVLGADGRLHTAPLRNARATDNYRLAGGGPETLEPPFTFHGFRYAEIACGAGVEISRVEVVWIGSDLAYTGRFECADESLNRLFANAVASQKANFISLPTDCPQRDERLGWTGDIQVFAEAACFNADSRSFLANWLLDVAAEQRGDGNVPSTVPNVIAGHDFEYGGVGWGDAATLVPWTLYAMYGDAGVLANQYDSMRRWVDYCASRRDANGVWLGDFHLGDWLDPTAPPDRPFEAATDSDFIANCYLSYSARKLGDAARVLGRADDSERYGALSREVAAATWRRWSVSAATTQTGCAIAIMFAVAPEADIAKLGAQLAQLVEANGNRIATGFLGTPLVLPALSTTGHTETAYRLLLNRDCPGWLYQVDRGATTMWERWDAVRADGSLHAGTMSTAEANSMISFNHYAYGAVVTWLYRTVAGLSYDPEQPGFGHVRFAPQPGGGLGWAGAAMVTGQGRASIRWTVRDGGLAVELGVPAGATATFACPSGWEMPPDLSDGVLRSGEYRFVLRQRGSSKGQNGQDGL
jgi:alpha-L-rhamnosidase